MRPEIEKALRTTRRIAEAQERIIDDLEAALDTDGGDLSAEHDPGLDGDRSEVCPEAGRADPLSLFAVPTGLADRGAGLESTPPPSRSVAPRFELPWLRCE